MVGEEAGIPHVIHSVRTRETLLIRWLHELLPVFLRENVRKVDEVFKGFDHSLAAPGNLTFFGCGTRGAIDNIKKMKSFAFRASAAKEDAKDLQNERVELHTLITLLLQVHRHIVVGHAQDFTGSETAPMCLNFLWCVLQCSSTGTGTTGRGEIILRLRFIISI